MSSKSAATVLIQYLNDKVAIKYFLNGQAVVMYLPIPYMPPDDFGRLILMLTKCRMYNLIHAPVGVMSMVYSKPLTVRSMNVKCYNDIASKLGGLVPAIVGTNVDDRGIWHCLYEKLTHLRAEDITYRALYNFFHLLGKMHELGIMHGDIHDANVMKHGCGSIALVDAHGIHTELRKIPPSANYVDRTFESEVFAALRTMCSISRNAVPTESTAVYLHPYVTLIANREKSDFRLTYGMGAYDIRDVLLDICSLMKLSLVRHAH